MENDWPTKPVNHDCQLSQKETAQKMVNLVKWTFPWEGLGLKKLELPLSLNSKLKVTEK